MELESEIPVAELSATWAPLYKRLRERIDIHVASAVKRNQRYKRVASFFNIATPISALALTIVATSSFKYHERFTVGIAVAVTVLTGINSILEPGRRYADYVQSCIELHDIRFDMEGWVRVSANLPDDEAMQWLTGCNERVSLVGRRMSGLPIARSMI